MDDGVLRLSQGFVSELQYVADVGHLGLHDLSCRKCQDTHSHHTVVKELVWILCTDKKLWCHGIVDRPWFVMPHAWTHILLHMWYLQPRRFVQWQFRQNNGRLTSVPTSVSTTISLFCCLLENCSAL